MCDSHHDAVVLRHFWTTVLHRFGIFMYSYIWNVPILHLTFMFYGAVYYSKKIGVHAIEWCKSQGNHAKDVHARQYSTRKLVIFKNPSLFLFFKLGKLTKAQQTVGYRDFPQSSYL